MTNIAHNPVPQHIAIIMDGNRRWAKELGLPVAAGHVAGAKQVRNIVQQCAQRGVAYLTLFAFSTENWRRPQTEVTGLMTLLSLYLKKEVAAMHANGVRLRVVGDIAGLPAPLPSLIKKAEEKTSNNTKITLSVAVNYGGRWDVVRAVKAWQVEHPGQSMEALNEVDLNPYFALSHAPDPDLLVRTGGESRISNFMLWQLAYTEMFFTDVLWPSFGNDELDQAIQWYGSRDRRFGGSPSNA